MPFTAQDYLSRTQGTLAIGPSAEIGQLPTDATFLRILGVNYVHLMSADEGDLYVTEHGLPFVEHLQPINWYERAWFEAKRERLHGTGTVYRVPTRPLPGQRCKSIPLVVKWCRVGEDVPLNTFTLGRAIDAEFNSPFEEFSMVEELRAGRFGPRNIRILCQKPLAIYVPPESMQLWQTGRSLDKLRRKVTRHAGFEMDALRSYIMLYGWLKGMDAVNSFAGTYFDRARQQVELAKLTEAVERDLEAKGFFVADHKPTHFILRLREGQVRRRKQTGRIVYGLVDYELLVRTAEHEGAVKQTLRSKYLLLQRDRFRPRPAEDYPPHLKPAQVMGVDYVWGRAESTNGTLWVVGNDAELFSYFLPERWRNRQMALSASKRTYYAQTKDRIHLVWRVSSIGDLPGGDLADPGYRPLLFQGYNSPFEEVALALEMKGKGLRTTYPRAVYATGHTGGWRGAALDSRRFDKMKDVLDPGGNPALDLELDYVTVWGYFRGLEDAQAPEDVGYWTPIGADQAVTKGLVTEAEFTELVARHRAELAAAGYEDVAMRGDHILLCYVPGGGVKRDAAGQIELRHCNFEFVRRVGKPG